MKFPPLSPAAANSNVGQIMQLILHDRDTKMEPINEMHVRIIGWRMTHATSYSGKAKENAEYYALRLQNYLIAYSNQIPQYLESVGNQTQIYPDLTNQYFGGIQL